MTERSPADRPNYPEDMTLLFLGILKKGPTWSPEATPEVMANQAAHLDLLARLGREGKVVLAGPIPEGEVLRGFVVCRAGSLEQARAYFAGDAHLGSRRLDLDIYPWMVPSRLLGKPLISPG